MKAVLIRTGSSPVHGASPAQGVLKISIGDHDSMTGILFPGAQSPRLHYKKKDCSTSIRRTMSETDMIRSGNRFSCRRSVAMSGSGSRSFPARIPEKRDETVEEGRRVVVLKRGLSQICEEVKCGGLPVKEVLPEEFEFSGGKNGNGRKIGGVGGGSGNDLSGGNADQRKIDEYYQEMVKANPGNPLLLRNYGQYLHEVKGDMVKAEECYQRAILASPGDGEVLSLYGKLIWDAHRDEERATIYFDQAVEASPDDCFVLGSYAHFLWNSDEDDEEESQQMKTRSSPAMVEAF